MSTNHIMTDDRPNIVDLIIQHRQELDIILTRASEFVKKEKLEYVAQEMKLDDVVALRFYLSALTRKKSKDPAVELATTNLCGCLLWRVPRYERFSKITADYNVPPVLPDKDNQWIIPSQMGPFLVTTAFFGKFDTGAPLQRPDGEKWMTEYHESLHEWQYKVLDDITRRTGKLTKLLSICDMTGLSMTNLNPRAMRILSDVSKVNDLYRPQYVHKTVIIHAPFIFRVVWKLFSPLFPKALMEKIYNHSGTGVNESGDASQCPYLKKLVSTPRLYVATVFGGDLPTPSFV